MIIENGDVKHLCRSAIIAVSTPLIVKPGVVCPEGTAVQINSPTIVENGPEAIISRYQSHQATIASFSKDGNLEVNVTESEYLLKTAKNRPSKLGLMMVGWGGNNGSTLTAALLANKHGLTWQTRRGRQEANFYGSLVMSSTVPIGYSHELGRDICVPLCDLLPILHPNDLVIGGWDISNANLAEAAKRACVLEPDLIRQIEGDLSKLHPLPSVYYSDFIAGNQAERANNLIPGTREEQLQVLREHIRSFKAANHIDQVIVLWTANTERFSRLISGVHDSSNALLAAIRENHSEVSPSTLFAVAAILEGCPFINGSPQNTLVPGLIELASVRGIPVAGDDFKSGQTKVKSVLTDFLIQSGIKPISIVSYNHLGNNDGRNLAEKAQFESKRVTKSGVVHDMVLSNPVLYPPVSCGHSKAVDVEPEGPDHVIVIEYVPAVGDCKRAMDEYESEIFMGGRNTLAIHNSCEDSLLAAPIMLDLVLLMELFGRIQVARVPTGLKAIDCPFESLHPVMGLLSFLLKAPVVPSHAPVVNALMKQRRAIETILKAAIGLPPTDDLALEHRLTVQSQ